MFNINNEIKIKDYLNDKLIRLDIIRLDNYIVLLQTTFT